MPDFLSLSAACGPSDITVAVVTLLVSGIAAKFYTDWRIETMLRSEKQRFVPVLNKE